MDIVNIGDATLYHGDCMDILPTLDNVTAVVTDPPYGIYDNGGKWGRKSELVWDKGAAIDIVTYIAEMECEKIIWGGNYYELPISRGWLVWHKRDSVPSSADVELAWTSMDMNSRYIDCTIASTNKERNGHPTIKPVRVMKWCLSFIHWLEKSSSPGFICDPFMGSGTTGVACAHEYRFIGIEKERKYFDIACERIEAAYAQGRLAFNDV